MLYLNYRKQKYITEYPRMANTTPADSIFITGNTVMMALLSLYMNVSADLIIPIAIY